MSCTLVFGKVALSIVVRVISAFPWYTRPEIPCEQSTVHISPILRISVASLGPHDARDTKLSTHNSGMTRSTSVVGNDSRSLTDSWHPVWIGHIGNKNITPLHLGHVGKASNNSDFANRSVRANSSCHVGLRLPVAMLLVLVEIALFSGRACTIQILPVVPSFAHSMSIGGVPIVASVIVFNVHTPLSNLLGVIVRETGPALIRFLGFKRLGSGMRDTVRVDNGSLLPPDSATDNWILCRTKGGLEDLDFVGVDLSTRNAFSQSI